MKALVIRDVGSRRVTNSLILMKVWTIVNQAMRATDEKPQFLKRPESKQKMLDLQELALSSSKYYSTKGFIKEAVGYYFPNE